MEEKNLKNMADRIHETINTITPIYGLAFIKKENNEEYPFADFYGNNFLPKENASKKEIERECEENNKELMEMLNDLEKEIKAEYGNKGIIKGELKLDVRLINFCGDDKERHSKFSNILACETKEDALNKFKYYYAEAKMTEEEKKAREKASLDNMSKIIEKIADL